MATEIKIDAEKRRITETSKVVVSDIVTVGATRLRSFKFWGSAGVDGDPIFEITVEAAAPESILIHTPNLTF